MKILGNYVVFFIFMMAMTLADYDNEYQQFYNDMLDLHNEYREKHNAQPLRFDKELIEAAMRLAKNFGTDVDANLNMGTNVYFEHDISNLDARNVFFSWYNEVDEYTYVDDPKMRSKTRCFTQIVWKTTEKLGVAVFPLENILIIVVTYSPRGNIQNEYMKNVVSTAIPKNGSSSSSSSKKQRSGV